MIYVCYGFILFTSRSVSYFQCVFFFAYLMVRINENAFKVAKK